MDALFNDLIKINENKLCFISTSESKEEFYIIVLNIYDNTKVAIRYYNLNIFSIYTFKIYTSISASLYNNFISLAFSFCRTQSCSSTNDVHYPGFMIFSYPNGTDYNEKIIDLMFTNNERIDSYTIDLYDQVRIDNNIFGLITSKIKIKNILNCNNINLFSSKTNTEVITEGSLLADKDDIIAYFNSFSKTVCSISYLYYITEPEFDIYNSYSDETVFPDSYNKDYFIKDKYESRLLYYNLSINENLSDTCQDNNNCLLCKERDTSLCIVCKNNYYTSRNEQGVKIKICIEEGVTVIIPTFIEETEPPKIEQNEDDDDNDEIEDNPNENNETNKENIIETSDIEQNKENNTKEEIKKECSYLEILNNECKDGTLSTTQLVEVYKQIKDFLSYGNYDGQAKEISTENVIYEISTFEYQKGIDLPNVSSIDLGTCEADLRSHYNISDNDSLIMLKIDLKNEDLSQTYVHYELFDPYEYTLLNISFCNSKITISTPIDLDDNAILFYQSLLKYGYNIFDSGDSFYNDICSLYTTPNGTDIIIEDRKENIYFKYGNISMCQVGCEFIYYNTTTKKSVCDCEIKEISDNELNDVEFSSKKLADGFTKTLSNSNFRVMKCYKLALNTKKLLKNIGRIMMTVIFIFYLISLFCYIIVENKKIDKFINIILKNKESNININNNKLLTEKDKKGKNNKKNKGMNNKTEVRKYESKNIFKKKETKKSELKDKKAELKNKKKKKNGPPKKRRENKKVKKQDLLNSTDKVVNTHSLSPSNKKRDNNKNININIFPISDMSKNKTKFILIPNEGQKSLDNININNKNDSNLINYENLNDEELNSLEYPIAVIIDKRSYFQYYWSLLKKKQLILFTILPANDYNLYTLKISLFLLSFSLYLTINGFFFSDSTMHNITKNNGKVKIIEQIAQILLSSIISVIINMILKMLSLSEKNILKIKKEENLVKAKNEAKKIKKCIIAKFVTFFIISFLFLVFFWYFISCFCAVYINTQFILFKDTIISFGLSMIYPFGLNLLPGIFRIPALRDKNQNSKCLYKMSGFIALI